MAKGQLTEEVVEQVADQLEEVAEVTRSLSGRDMGFLFAGLGIGLAAGFGIGWVVSSKRLELKYHKISEDEIEMMREHYQERTASLVGKMEREKPPIDKVVEDLGYQPAIPAVDYRSPAEKMEEEAMHEQPDVVVNVFEQAHPEMAWDYRDEIKKRTRDRPFVIHKDEFDDNEGEYENATYTYYEGDDILADGRDGMVEPVDEIVGLDNLQRFGHGSNDMNVVYIRNDALTIDIEICRSPGSYSEEVHGVVEHSEESSRRRLRGFDDG